MWSGAYRSTRGHHAEDAIAGSGHTHASAGVVAVGEWRDAARDGCTGAAARTACGAPHIPRSAGRSEWRFAKHAHPELARRGFPEREGAGGDEILGDAIGASRYASCESGGAGLEWQPFDFDEVFDR